MPTFSLPQSRDYYESEKDVYWVGSDTELALRRKKIVSPSWSLFSVAGYPMMPESETSTKHFLERSLFLQSGFASNNCQNYILFRTMALKTLVGNHLIQTGCQKQAKKHSLQKGTFPK